MGKCCNLTTEHIHTAKKKRSTLNTVLTYETNILDHINTVFTYEANILDHINTVLTYEANVLDHINTVLT
jgi:hypothetical protein